MLGHLGGGEEGVRGGCHGAEEGGAKEGEDEFRGIGKEDHDDVTLSNAEFVQPGGDSPGGELDVVVSVDIASGGIDQARAGSEFGEILEAVRMKRDVFGDVDVWKFGPEDELGLGIDGGLCGGHWRS